MLTIGLTGGIGSGKSEVARALEEFGAVVVNADRVGHQAYAPNTEAWHEVVAAFGEDILAANGEVDRKKLGAVVFSDPKALARLNRIMHPRIYQAIAAQLQRLREQGVRVAVVEAALLIEAGWLPLVDEVWVVSASEEAVVQRVRARTSLSEDEVRRRIRSQMSAEERRRYADVVIENEGTLEELRQRVRALWEERVRPRV